MLNRSNSYTDEEIHELIGARMSQGGAPIEEVLAVAQYVIKMGRDAERWRFARTIFAIEDVERVAEEMRGSASTEEENAKADRAIDEAMDARTSATNGRQGGHDGR